MTSRNVSFRQISRSQSACNTGALEGGFEEDRAFYYIPISVLDSKIEVFHQRVFAMLMDPETA